MLPDDDTGIELIVQADTRTHAAEGRLQGYPIAGRDAAFPGGSGVHFDFRMGRALAQAWQSAMLRLWQNSVGLAQVSTRG